MKTQSGWLRHIVNTVYIVFINILLYLLNFQLLALRRLCKQCLLLIHK